MAAASVCVRRVRSTCLLILWETPQDQQVGLLQAPFKSLLLSWVLDHVSLCVCPLSAESLFPTALWVSWKWSPLAFKAKYFRGSTFQCRIPGLGSHASWENFCSCNYSPLCGLPTSGIRFDCTSSPFSTPPACHCGSLFISLVVEGPFC